MSISSIKDGGSWQDTGMPKDSKLGKIWRLCWAYGRISNTNTDGKHDPSTAEIGASARQKSKKVRAFGATPS
jgi:hypothetical protein